MNFVDTLLHPTLCRIIESGDPQRALNTAKRLVEIAEKDKDINTFQRSGKISNAWFQVALIHEILGNLTDAVDAAKNAYQHDNWLFFQHPTLVRLAVALHDEPSFQFAVDVARWHTLARTLEYHHSRSTETEIVNLLEPHQHDSSAVKWYLEDRKFNVEMDAAWTILVRTGEVILDAPLSRIKQWRREDRDPIECDVAECRANYFTQRKQRVLEVWGEKDPSLAKSPIPFARLLRVKIDLGEPLPDTLTLPHSLETNEWFVAAEETVHAIWKYLSDGFAGDFTQEDLQLKVQRHLQLAQQLCLHCIAIYQDFLDGKVVGRATSPFLYAQLLRLYGITLEKSDAPKEALAYYRKAMKIFPFPELAQSIISAALDLNKGPLAMSATQWLERHFGDNFTFQDAHRNDRLRLWAAGIYQTLPTFLTLLDNYRDKYRELHRITCGFNSANAGLLPEALSPYMDEHLSAVNNIWHALQALWEKYPENPDLIALMLENRYYFISDSLTRNWIDGFLNNINILRENADDEPGRQRLFLGLNAAGFLVGRTGLQDPENDTNPQRIREGLLLLEEAAALAETTDVPEIERMRNLLDRGRLLHEIGELEQAEHLYTRVINRLGPGPRFCDEILDDPNNKDLLNKLPLEGLPTYILFLAYYFRGYLKVMQDAPASQMIGDLKGAHAMHPTMSQLCLSLAELLLLDPKTASQALPYALRFIELERDRKNPDRAVMLGIVADNYLDAGRISDAKYLIYELERNFPNDPALPSLKEKLN